MKRRAVVALAVFTLVGVGCFSWLASRLYDAETDAISRSFRSRVNQQVTAFEREVLLHLEILHALKPAFENAGELDYDTFDRLTRGVLKRSPALQALAWAPYVSATERDDYVSRLLSEQPGFQLSERNEQNELVPVTSRGWYVPMAYIQPLATNSAALGFDLASEPRRLEALLAARDSGGLAATAGVRLIQEPTNQRGVLVFLPFYDGASSNSGERANSHYAFLIGVYRVGELFRQSIGVTVSENILLRMLDRTEGEPEELFSTADINQDRWNMAFSYTQPLADIAGRDWAVQAVPSDRYLDVQRGNLPLLVLFAGLLLIALLDIYVIISLRRNGELAAAKRQLERISMTDGLTNLANRRHFDHFLETEWARAQRQRSRISLIMIDIDHFKEFNDEYGHPAGDECLRQVAQALEGVARRPTDLVARYGGEEFAMILPDTDNATQLAELCRKAVEALQIKHHYSKVADVITISAGVCTLTYPDGGMTAASLTKKADQALYQAKESGRNKVVSNEPTAALAVEQGS